MPKYSQAPPIRSIRNIQLPEHEVREYPNGLKLIIVNAGAQEVFKLETIFHAGRFYEQEKLISGTTLRMIREGGQGYSSERIAETIDFYGATLSTPTHLDFSGTTLYGLNQHFDTLLELYQSVILTPTFPEVEFSDYITERKQRLQVDLSKNDVIAYRNVTEAIFGSHHPYGYNSVRDMYDSVGIDQLRAHHENHYRSGNCTVVISGKISQGMIQRLENEFFPRIPTGHSKPKTFSIIPHQETIQHFTKPNSVQTAIRMGKRLFDRKHEDYLGLYCLNVILGDYFSSRLMMNIREDKGYTYNIYSMLDIMKHNGMLLISTETANEHTRATIKEIHHEFERLRTEPIPKEEMEMARNYTMGTMLTALDGPFNSSVLIKGLFLNDMDKKHFDALIQTIQNINQDELMRLANKYLTTEDMYTVTVGA